MASLYSLEVVTPQQMVLQKKVEMVIARTVNGDVGVMANHIPMVAALKPGALRVRGDEKEQVLAVSGGFLEVGADGVTILATTAEHANEINIERAQKAKERAERRLAQKTADIDQARAEAALRRAMARIDVAQRGQ